MKDAGKLTAGSLIELQPSTRLNIVFDIDHTLIFSIDKKLYPRLDLHPDYKCFSKISQIHEVTIPNGVSKGYEMWLIVRYNVPQMLQYLHDFCTFYVYSHGLYEYVMAIL